MSLVGDVPPNHATSLRIGNRVVVLIVRELEVIIDLQPWREFVTRLETHVICLELIGLLVAIEQSVVRVETTGQIVVELIVGTGDREILVLGEYIVLIHYIIIVCTFRIVNVAALSSDGTIGDYRTEITRLVPALILLQPCDGELLCFVDTRGVRMVVIVIRVIEMLRPDITIRDHVRHVLRRLQRVAGRPRHFRLSLRGVLRGD